MPKPVNASSASKELIDAHRQWLLETSRILGITVTEVAKGAKLAPTTLTRLASDPDHPHALSSTTIDKIVRTYGGSGIVSPISPDFGAFRDAIAKAIASLHRLSALQAAGPEVVANTVLDLADWLLKAGQQSPEQFEAVASFEAERLRRHRST